MGKYHVKFPEGNSFTGTYLSVPFVGGEGQTDDDWIASRFREKGLIVEQETTEKPLSKMKVDELKAYAEEKGIDISEAKTKDEILAAIEAAEPKE